jgi:hypothetical protein
MLFGAIRRVSNTVLCSVVPYALIVQSTFISINKLSICLKCIWVYLDMLKACRLQVGPLGSCGLNHGKGEGIFSLLQSALCPTQTSIQWVLAALSLVAKQPGHEDDKLPPSSAKVKREWSYICTPAYAFMVHMGSLYLQLWMSWSITSFS